MGTIEIPGGTIELSDARTGSSREVDLATFALGRTPVTTSAYRPEVGGGGDRHAGAPAHPVTWFADAAQGWSADADRRRADVRGPLPLGWTPLR